MFNEQLALQSKANICGKIVREQSKIICGLEQNQRNTIWMHVHLKKKCKTNWSFKPGKGRTKVRKKMLRKEISHTKKQNLYKRPKRWEIKLYHLEEEVNTLKEKSRSQ